jgi:hypothetical protein
LPAISPAAAAADAIAEDAPPRFDFAMIFSYVSPLFFAFAVSMLAPPSHAGASRCF